MTEAAVRTLLGAEPFGPFTIRMTSKSSYEVSRPESVSFPPSGEVLQSHTGGQLHAILSHDHFACIELIPRPVIQPTD